MKMHSKNILAALIASTLLAGCSGSGADILSSINPFKQEEERLPGTRIAINTDSYDDTSGNGRTAKIASAQYVAAWPQSSGNRANNSGNADAQIKGLKVWQRGLASGDTARHSVRPVFDGTRLYIYRDSGEVWSLNAANGDTLWRAGLRPDDESEAASGGGAAVRDGQVFVASAYQKLAVFDAKSGKLNWEVPLDAPAGGPPAVDDKAIYLVTQTNEAIALSKKDGSELWRFTGIAETAGVLGGANPAISGAIVVVPFSSGEVIAFNRADGSVIWIETLARAARARALSGLADVAASPVIAGNYVILSGLSGSTVALDLKTGARLWSQEFGALHTPIISGNAVFMIDLDERLIALELRSGDVLWTADLAGEAGGEQYHYWAGPILAGGQLITLSSAGKMLNVDATTGAIVSRTRIGGGAYLAPIIAGKQMIALIDDDRIAAIR